MTSRPSSVLFGFFLMCVSSISGAAGRVADGAYFGPLGNFSVTLPNWRALKIQDRDDENFSIVAFLDRGDLPAPLLSIAALRLTADLQGLLADPPERDDAYRKFLSGFAMPNLFLNVSPASSVVHQGFVDLNGQRAYLAVVIIPEGHASFRDGKTGKQADSVSGLLIFHNKSFMYLLRTEMKGLFNSTLNASSLSSKDLESMQQKLLQFKNSMKFID